MNRNKIKYLILTVVVCVIWGILTILLALWLCKNDEPRNNKTFVFSYTNEETKESEEIPTEEIVENKPELKSLGVFKATAYCPCEICCGVWAKNRPLDENGNPIVYTASGERAIQGVTIAADTNKLPFGTEVYINGNKYIVHDRGGAVNGNRIDIYFDNHAEASKWGLQEVEVFVRK